jgi:hypothetical protein
MGNAQRHFADSTRAGDWLPRALILLAIAVAVAVLASTAGASVGYEPDASTPVHSLGGKVPHGIAVDQANQRIYVAAVTNNPTTGAAGDISRFESDLTAAGTFSAGGGSFYTGVAVNPLTQGFYAVQARLHTPFGNIGTARMDLFSSSGTPGTSVPLSDAGTLPQIATDSAGNVYYPDASTGAVKVFDSAGALQGEIGCSGCPGSSSFGKPVSVALSSKGDLYVVDLAPDRVVKLTSSGGAYSFASVLQSGRGAAAVAVDPSGDDVFVGDLPSGRNYHVVAYSSSGTQFDDFGAGLFTDPEPPFGPIIAPQIAANATTHKLYVSDAGKLHIFDKVTITPPTATIKPAPAVGQLTATLRAAVNAKGHAVLECEFEYTDDADFQANGYANADTKPCPSKPDGASDTTIDAKVAGLSPLTIYHYRVSASSNAGPVTSGAETLETLPEAPPAVTTEPPLAVAQSTATLSGMVDPQGGSVSDCFFEYGTSLSYGFEIPCSELPGPVTTDVAEIEDVSGLAVGTAYHYRLVVSSNAGTTEGNDVEFKTASPPPSPQKPPVTGTPPATTAPAPVVPGASGTTKPPPPHCRKGFRKKRVRGKLRCVKKRRAKHRRAHRSRH